ncbi:MAG: DUF1294 domain-containing protein [Methanofollis sp.]|uniref:DUF1294 domain-containing protein n=1 Tax=Methanofollis sp. TaxID=2052835 RepID=UPI00261D9430|nr:DUF1294 domain-containing protein [Methanofollis sp.]MDD4254418.1 DUF1294 domain-containing protein [Methanofollis sp.]
MSVPGLDLLVVYLLLNAGAAAVFYADKGRARQRRWRISETMLLTLAFLGPFGALAAMKVFRHKTQKTKFLLVPLFAALHLAIFALVACAGAGWVTLPGAVTFAALP